MSLGIQPITPAPWVTERFYPPSKVSGLQGRTPRVIFGLYIDPHTYAGATPLPPHQHAYAHTTYICTYIHTQKYLRL